MDESASDIWIQVLFLFLGWLLGLLSPVVVDAIQQERKRRELLVSIAAELRELQLRLVNAAYLTTIESGQFDRQFAEWYQRKLANYAGSLVNPGMMPAALASTLAATDAQIVQAGVQLKNPPGQVLGLKSFDAPLLRSKIDEIGQYPVSLQSLLLEIISRLRLINEEVAQYRYYFQQTFVATGQNHILLTGNIQTVYRAVTTQARKTADYIDEALAAIDARTMWARLWQKVKRQVKEESGPRI